MPTCITPGSVQNMVTEMRYGPGGQLVELIARNPATGDQVTRYEYGVTLAESGIASNDLLRAEIYPDAAASTDRVSYAYNRQGQRTRMQDQNGSVHEYEYDSLGRQAADKITLVGSGVDGAVRRISTSYEVRGLVEKVTSYSDAAGTTPVNEVQNVYNSFAQLAAQHQEHSGSVNTGTTPKVEYAHADGSANTTRPTGMTYPNGRVLDYLYDDTPADKLSRIRTLRWDGTDVCRYSYLGLSTFVATDYLQPQVKLDYAQGSGANPYTGFDRFGRIIDLLWGKYGANSSSSSSSSGGAGNDLVHLKYGYDLVSNRTHREDLVAQAYGKDFDELYEYDGLHRLKKFHRGRLTDDNRAITSPTLQQGWQLDATSNWKNFTQNDQVDPNQTLDQQRLANRVNEITQIARTVGPQWATPEYDRNGNMTVIPQPKDMTTTFQGTWDAWNRLVKLEESNGSGGWQTLAEYQYDGQTWRILKKIYDTGVLDETRHFYFSSRWQDIEERLGTSPNSANAQQQYVCGLRYVDEIILRDRDTDGNGSLDERLYALQDANWNVVAIMETTGVTQERFAYTAYGEAMGLSETFAAFIDSFYRWNTLFCGYKFETETSLTCVRYRFFQTKIGAWLGRDSLVRTRVLQLYRYCDDSPLSKQDPLGLEPTVGCCGLDVSNYLKALKTVIPLRMAGLTQANRRKLCNDLHTSDGWDIQEFAMAGTKGGVNSFEDKIAGCGTVNPKLFLNPKANMDLCGGSVTVCGKCAWAAEANYYLYGIASRVCHDSGSWYEKLFFDWGDTAAWVIAYRQYYGVFDLRYSEFLPSPPEMAGDEQIAGYPFILPYGRDIGPGVTGRLHWAKLGYDQKDPCQLRRATKRCTPCSKPYRGSLSIKLGNPAKGNGFVFRLTISEWMASAYEL